MIITAMVEYITARANNSDRLIILATDFITLEGRELGLKTSWRIESKIETEKWVPKRIDLKQRTLNFISRKLRGKRTTTNRSTARNKDG